MKYRWLALVTVSALVVPMLLACGSPSPAKGPDGPAAVPEATSAQREEPTAAPASNSGGGSGDPTERVTDALGLLLGSSADDDTPVLPSCHIELTSTWPGWDGDASKVVDHSISIQGDMQGKNVHFSYSETQTVDGETEETGKGEGIIDGEANKEYEIVDGQVQEGIFIGLAWVTWPLQPVIVLSLSGLGATPEGTEAIDGRTAEVYAVDMAKADPAVLAGVQAFIAKGMKQARGKVWVDQATGALLKANLDYEEDLYEMGTDTVVGHGSGHFEILVTKVGQVTVEVPAGD